MNILVKNFSELTTVELYNLLQLRSEIFVVEQDCVYQDVDGKDQTALHVIGSKNGEVVAYTRIFAAGDYLEKASIGRVVVKASKRTHGYGGVIMKASIAAVEEHFKEKTIVLSAQTYLKRFYNSLGFKEIGAEYLEDGIPHIKMIKN